MSIAEKITRAKADLDEVYNAGYTKGKAEGGGYEQGVADGIEQGKRSVMVAVQQGGTRTAYSDTFSTPYWTDEAFCPLYDMHITQGIRMFKQSSITDLKGILERQGVVLDTSACGNFYEFASGSTITRVPIIDATGTPNLTQLFYNCRNLISVEKLILTSDGSITFENTFSYCEELVHLTIEGVIGAKGFNLRWSTKLNKTSHESVITALSTTTTGLTVTLSKTAVNNAFATAEGLADGSTSAEWLALVATRSNWTIALA